MKQNNLEDRLVNYAALAIDKAESLPATFTFQHLSRQLVRSATSAALNYGEAQVAESKADFIHKNKIVLKELKEALVCIKILGRRNAPGLDTKSALYRENLELIRIFVATVKKARLNLNKSQ